MVYVKSLRMALIISQTNCVLSISPHSITRIWIPPQFPGMLQYLRVLNGPKKKKPQLVGVYVILLGWMGVFCLLLLQKGQTKVTMDTPSSYCTTADNFLSNELQLYFWVLRYVTFQKKRQWVRFIHEQTLCSDLGLTFSFLFYWWQLKHRVWAAVFFLCKSGRFAVLRNTTNVKMKTFLV